MSVAAQQVLHWAGKMRNERKHACTDFVAKRRTNFCNNYSQLQQLADVLQGLNRG